MEIKNVTDQAFRKYGKVISDFICNDLMMAMDFIQIPTAVEYKASEETLEICESTKVLANSLYGGMPIQVGYCNGHNKALNAFEYHRDSEINIAVTDLVLILGSEQDINEDYTYDTSLAEAFFVPAGTVVEVYGTTLHYAPCHVDENGFKCIVVLPKDTNTAIEKQDMIKEDRLLFARNKWLIAHAESGLEAEGAFVGLKGVNVTL